MAAAGPTNVCRGFLSRRPPRFFLKCVGPHQGEYDVSGNTHVGRVSNIVRGSATTVSSFGL
jgi:hypothetical protein